MEREESLFVALRAHLKSAVANSPYWAEQLAQVDIEAVTDREALANLPVLSKSDLVELQDKKNHCLAALRPAIAMCGGSSILPDPSLSRSPAALTLGA